MRALGMVAMLAVAACAGAGTGHDGGAVAPTGVGKDHSRLPSQQAASESSPSQPFAGAWESCEGASSPEECSRYLLVQHGDRICGTWSYLASGKAYNGRVVARVTSPTQARRTHVCGRPGAETDTECSDGWQSIDKPLLLCGGRLGDLAGADGACVADYQPAPASQAGWTALQVASWVRDCLSGAP